MDSLRDAPLRSQIGILTCGERHHGTLWCYKPRPIKIKHPPHESRHVEKRASEALPEKQPPIAEVSPQPKLQPTNEPKSGVVKELHIHWWKGIIGGIANRNRGGFTMVRKTAVSTMDEITLTVHKIKVSNIWHAHRSHF